MSSSAATGPRASDPVAVDPKHYTVEFEDDRVRVLRIRYGPGERSTMHSHPQAIAVMLTDANIRMTYPDGTTEDMQVGPGTVLPMPGVEHLPENLSDRGFEAIEVELK